MTNMDDEATRTASFVRAELAHLDQWWKASWANIPFEHSNHWWMLTTRTMETALELSERGQGRDAFLAYAHLAGRWLSHQRSVWILASYGRYGDTTALMRMLYEVSDLLMYFGMNPGEAADWREASRAGTRRARNWYPRAVRDALSARGVGGSTDEQYGRMSDAVHASEAGLRFYGARVPGDDEKLGLGFAPVFDARIGFGLLCQAFSTLPRPCLAFVEMARRVEVPSSRWQQLESDVNGLVPDWEAVTSANARMVELMAETEGRAVAGEDLGALFDDIRRRYVTDAEGDNDQGAGS